MVRLRVLGRIDLRDGAGRELRSVLAQPKRFAILCYLAIAQPRAFHRRDTLIGLFWPEADEEHARSALRQALHFLRHRLGDNVVTSRADDEIGIAPNSLWCDANAFEAAFAANSDTEAVELYGGDLLPGFFISEAPEFDRWMDSERMRLAEHAASALERLATAATADADYRTSIRQWRRLATMDPLNSRVAVGLMTSLAAAGDRAAAIRHADAHAALIREEVGGEADETVMALAKRLRSAESGRYTAASANAVQQTEVRSAGHLSKAGTIPPFSAGLGVPRQRVGWRTGIATVAVATAFGLAIAGASLSRRKDASLNPRRIAVAVLDNRTGDSAFTSLGRMAADWITQGLSRTELVDVVPAATALSAAWSWESKSRAYVRTSEAEFAKRTGAGLLVTGSYYRTGDSLQFRAEVTDGINNRLIGAPLMIGVPASASLIGVERLRQQVMGALAVGLNADFDRWARVTAYPPTFEAYQEFMTGQEIALENGPLRTAVEHWRRAVTIDSGYTQAWLSLANGLGELGDSAEADAAAQRLEVRRGRLTPVERVQLDHVQAQLRGDSYARLEAARRIVALTPGSCWLITLGTDAHFALHPRESVNALRQLDPEATCVRKDRDYWTALAMSLHLLGDYDAAVVAARRGRAQHPVEYQVIFAELGALSALGRVDDANRLIQESMSLPAGARRMPDQIKYDASDLMGIAASELRAHGHVDAAKRLYDQLIRWLESRPRAERGTEARRSVLARRMYEAGRYEDSRARFDSLVREYPDKYLYRAHLGVLAARRGDREQAMREDEWLAGAVKVRPRASHLIWRARIAALLGEKERAVSLIHDAVGQGYHRRYYLHWREDFEGLRGYKAFEDAIRPEG